jgi:hypothetical protein
MYHRWTKTDIRYVAEHASEGSQVIAAHFGVSSDAVRMLAYRKGITLGKVPMIVTNTCIECRQRPVYDKSIQAKELELCLICYRRWQIRQKEDELLEQRLEREVRSLSSRVARGKTHE